MKAIRNLFSSSGKAEPANVSQAPQKQAETSPQPEPAAPEQSAQASDANAADSGSRHEAASTTEPESSVIAVAAHCPPELLKDKWSLDCFDIRRKLYAGQISSVYRAIDRKSGSTVGLKLYKRAMLNDMERHQIAREIWLHIQLHHPSIIALYAAWKDRDYIYMMLEWAPEGNVLSFTHDRGGVLTENVAVPMILEPTMAALKYIHDMGMIHRDVKPENILMTDSYQIKLADFGLSIHASYEVANTRLGTLDYLAPEILDCPVKAHPLDHKLNPQVWYTNKVDCWSVGILAYELLLAKTPFEAAKAADTLYKIKNQAVKFPAHLSPGALDFMQRALVRDPAMRWDMQQLLEHPWIKQHSVAAARQPAVEGPSIEELQARLADAHMDQQQQQQQQQLTPPVQQPVLVDVVLSKVASTRKSAPGNAGNVQKAAIDA